MGPHDFNDRGVEHRLVHQRLSRLEQPGGQPGGPDPCARRHPSIAGTAPGRAGRRSRCRSASRRAHCWAPVRRGSNPGSNIPAATTRSGSDCATAPRWTACRCRCCSSAAGRTSFCSRRCSSTRTCARRGVDVALTIGPWTHSQLLSKGLATGTRETLDWLDTHLGGAEPKRPSRVRVYVTGQGWRNVADWPPATTERALYLRPGGYLDEIAPADLPEGRPGDLPLRPRRPDTHHRRSAAVGQRRIPDDSAARRARRRARVHQRDPHPRRLRLRKPGRRAGAQLGQSACRSVRPGQRGRFERPLPQRH